jgi:hypothetical protein
VAALAVAGLASWLVSWWFAPLDAVNMNRFDPSVFTARGIVAIGYAGFAFAFGVAAGALTRRTLPAMAATLVGFIAARIAFTLWVRPHLLATKHVLLSLTQGQNVGFIGSPTSVSVFASSPTIPNAWAISATLVDRAHHTLSTAQLHDLLARACPTIGGGLAAEPRRWRHQEFGGQPDGWRSSSPACTRSRITCNCSSPTSHQPLLAAAGTRDRDLPRRRARTDRRHGLARRTARHAQARSRPAA